MKKVDRRAYELRVALEEDRYTEVVADEKLALRPYPADHYHIGGDTSSLTLWVNRGKKTEGQAVKARPPCRLSASLVPSGEIQGTEIHVRFMDPRRPQTAGDLSSARPGVHRFVHLADRWRGLPKKKRHCG